MAYVNNDAMKYPIHLVWINHERAKEEIKTWALLKSIGEEVDETPVLEVRIGPKGWKKEEKYECCYYLQSTNRITWSFCVNAWAHCSIIHQTYLKEWA